MPQGIESENVIIGFLFEWESGSNLASIPSGYNVVCIVFSTDNSGMPNLSSLYLADAEVAEGVRDLKREGRTVLVTLGGANTYVALSENDQTAFVNQLIDVVNTYGFDGICLDLEGAAVTAADNQEVIPEALLTVRQYFAVQGRPFYITMTPEFPLLRGEDAPYAPYLERLEGNYDLIFPQYYNQGEDGVWLGDYYLAQDDDENKALFLYTLTAAIINGEQEYYQIPAGKLAIGLPTTEDAAFNGYVQDPADVAWALDQLASDGTPIRGLMGWSINHDSFNDYQFIDTYTPIVHGVL